jgi:hypothetical protein
MPDWLVNVILVLAIIAAIGSLVGHAANWMGWI